MRVGIFADMHCGHISGLTPPSYGFPSRESRMLWDFFARETERFAPIDVAIFNGDIIDGTGKSSGGTELITTDRLEQARMAAEVITRVGAKKNYVTYGTAYHVSSTGEDMESLMKEMAGVERVEGHGHYDVNGTIFDVRHYVGSSSAPHCRHTPIARERLWNVMWAERQQCPVADIIIRSHVHYFSYCGGKGWLAITTPALQGWGSKFGVRICSGIVDFGFLIFDVDEKGGYTWTDVLYTGPAQRVTVTRV